MRKSTKQPLSRNILLNTSKRDVKCLFAHFFSLGSEVGLGKIQCQ